MATTMDASSQLVPRQLPLGSLDAYILRVNQIPMLSQEEEHNLATRLQKQDDLQAAQALVLSHLRYVVRVARGYLGYGLPLGDLIQEGAVGLMKAIKRFDPEIGVRLVSFAVHWIKAEMHEYILKNWRIVKVATTKAQRKLFFNLRKTKKRLGWYTSAEVAAVANDLGVRPDEVRRMEERLNARDTTFDLPVESGGESDYRTSLVPSEYLEDASANPAVQFEIQNMENHAEASLKAAFKSLDPRSQDILEKRFLLEEGEKATLQDLATHYKISAERVRQLEKNALLKLKGALVEIEA
jgi:RNA polymerase sigma-32 factor